MGNFDRNNRDNRSGGGRDFNKRSSFGERRSFDDRDNRGSDRPMYQTVCSKCGRNCEVPFKPNGSKPVFCNDCFQNNKGSDYNRPESRPSERPNFSNHSEQSGRNNEQYQYKQQFEALNAKLDKILRILTPVVPAVAAPMAVEEKIVSTAISDEPEEQVAAAKPKKKATKKKPLAD
ncbi:MAG: hypothetical protein RI947_809 [Candidatus Parcubacteria bacterium]|jgi:CxxC-x17-CxxC domain-containing protein